MTTWTGPKLGFGWSDDRPSQITVYMENNHQQTVYWLMFENTAAYDALRMEMDRVVNEGACMHEAIARLRAIGCPEPIQMQDDKLTAAPKWCRSLNEAFLSAVDET